MTLPPSFEPSRLTSEPRQVLAPDRTPMYAPNSPALAAARYLVTGWVVSTLN